MNPHLHPPKIKSAAMDQLPTSTPITDSAIAIIQNWCQPQLPLSREEKALIDLARTLERKLLATQARERVLRSALEKFADEKNWRMNGIFDGNGFNFEGIAFAKEALNHP